MDITLDGEITSYLVPVPFVPNPKIGIKAVFFMSIILCLIFSHFCCEIR